MANTSISKLIGKGYNKFWHTKKFYKVVKGSRGSKKSVTTQLELIYKMMKNPWMNVLRMRRFGNTLRDSVYVGLKSATNRLGVAHLWKFTVSPMERTYLPTGQKILFRGFDDALKLTSIQLEKGHITHLWLEEAYELESKDKLDTVVEGMRGELDDPNAYRQVILTFNPWSEKSWLKSEFFDKEDDDIFTLTTTYKINEFLDKQTIKRYEKLYETNPRRAKIVCDGEWGIAEGLVFEENWRVEVVDKSVVDEKGAHEIFGLDYGYTNDPTALFVGVINLETRKLYVMDEMYEKKLSNEQIAENIKIKGYQNKRIVADSAEPKSNNRLRTLGIRSLIGARKGKDSVRNGIDFLQGFEIIIDPRCRNFIKEISNYAWDEDKYGNKVNVPIDDFNHLMDAMRYACEPYIQIDLFSFD